MNKLNPLTLKNTPAITKLVTDITDEITFRQAKAAAAVENEKLQMHHAIGAFIKTHLLENKDRADYGGALMKLLAVQVGMNKTDLYASVLFFELYPEIFQTSGKLKWCHIKPVLQVKSEVKRRNILKKIETENLTVKAVETIVSKYMGTHKKQAELALDKATLKPPSTRGKPYTYRLIEKEGDLLIDLGFGIECSCPEPGLTVNSVVESVKTGQVYTFNYMGEEKSPYYTYKAQVISVIDADTLWVRITLGFGNFYTQKIRLKGIDAPPLGTLEGEAAKAFLEAELTNCKFIAIRTFWRDKFLRYLADVFYLPEESDLLTVIETGTYLNGELVQAGHARRY